MGNLSFKTVFDVEPKMVLDIAMGLRPPADIAADYGLSEHVWEQLKAHEPFQKQVEDKRAELSHTGITFKLKAAVAAEEVLALVFKDAIAEDANPHTRLSAFNSLSRAAGLDTPVKTTDSAGTGFSITINLSGSAINIQGKQVTTVEHNSITLGEDDYNYTTMFEPYEGLPLDSIVEGGSA
jgi:hypothetical protein